MEMDDEERRLVRDASAQAGEAAPDAAPPVPQDEDEDIMVGAPPAADPCQLQPGMLTSKALQSGSFMLPSDDLQHWLQRSLARAKQAS
jgi:hypothetical protein